MSKSKPIKSTYDLRAMLIDTIEQVRAGEIDAKQASTIAKLSTTILQSAKLDLDTMRFRVAHAELENTQAKGLNLISEAG